MNRVKPTTKSQNTLLQFIKLMDFETPYTSLAPPVFDGDNYQIWAARMEAHLEANDLWEAVEEDYKVLPLPTNPTMAQIKNQKERRVWRMRCST